MLPYYIGDPKKRKLTTAHLDSPDLRCCTMFTLIFVLLFTCLSIFLRRNINEQYYVKHLIEDQFYTVFTESLHNGNNPNE